MVETLRRLFSRRRTASWGYDIQQQLPARKMVKQDSPLLNLPDEILLRVLGFIELEDLCSLRLSQSHLNDLAQEYVFESFDLLYGRRAERLAAMLRRDDRRAQWIKTLLVSTKYDDDEGLSRLPEHLSKMVKLEDLVLETPDCNNRTPADRVKWVKLQNQYEAVFRRSSVAFAETDRLLPQLKACTLHFVDDRVSLYPLTKYSSIFLHPTLKQLTLSCACTDTPDRILQHFRHHQRSTALEYLHLEECDFDPESLSILLQFPKGLRSLKLSEGIRYSKVSSERSRLHGNLVPALLSRALASSVTESLEHLSLKLGYMKDKRPSMRSPGRRLDLTALAKLRFLELSLSTLTTIMPNNNCEHTFERSLPASIEHIRIFGIQPLLRGRPPIPIKTCLLTDKEGHGLPNLKQVTHCYEYQGLRGNPSAGFFRPEVYETLNRVIEATMKRVQTINNKYYPIYKDSNTRVVVECEITPYGYIPPYLRNEESPELKVIWDSSEPPLEALVEENKHRLTKEETDRAGNTSEATDELPPPLVSLRDLLWGAHVPDAGSEDDEEEEDGDFLDLPLQAAQLLNLFNMGRATDIPFDI